MSTSPVLGSTSPPPESTSPATALRRRGARGGDDTDEDIEGEDLINENMGQDYENIPELDTYDIQDLDTSSFEPIDQRARLQAEREMAARDRREGIDRSRGYLPRMLREQFGGDEGDEEIPSDLLLQRQGGRTITDWSLFGQQQIDQAEGGLVNLEDFQGPLREWLEEPRVIREVKNRFTKFLTTHTDKSGKPVYPNKIEQMARENKSSLEVSYMDLSATEPILAIWVADAPALLLEMFDEVAMSVVKYEFPDYDTSVAPHIYVRITELPLHDKLRDLRQLHLNAFIQVSGVVTRRTNIFPQLQLVRFDCIKCGNIIGPFAQQGDREIKPPSCPECQSSGPFRMNEAQTIYRNYQKIILQESPGSVPAGRIPRSRDVILVNDLCDTVRPGEQVTITGIYKNEFAAGLNAQQGFPVFSTIIEANQVAKPRDFQAGIVITDEDKQLIHKLSKRNDIESIIISSIAPSIYGHDYIKRSIMYSLFGGQEKRHENKHRVRGDINILILGDPGVGKSQFLKYVENVASRAVYATGKGASAVGLTASVRRDPMTREWTLEGGALVLADRGVCLIDEFDKMNDQDRTSIHEAMEQQSISISKAGIVATLQARCAVMAAANPIAGRYDGSLTFVENVDLTDPILSRFDVLAVVRDRVDPIKDEMLANFVVSNHTANHPFTRLEEERKQASEQMNATEEQELEDEQSKENKDGTDEQDDQQQDGGNRRGRQRRGSKKKQQQQGKEKSSMLGGAIDENGQISQEMLKKYILYAKQTTHPKLDNIDRDKISKFYADLRQRSMEGGGIPIAVRHIESILRLSEARAKLHLREYVIDEDVDMAIRCMLESFIDTQKQSVQTSLRKHFQQYLSFHKDSTELLLHLLESEVKEELSWRNQSSYSFDSEMQEQDVTIPLAVLREKADSMQISGLNQFFRSERFRQEGFVYDTKRKVIIKQFR